MNEAGGTEEWRTWFAHDSRAHGSTDVLEIGSQLTEARKARDFAERVVGDAKVGSDRRDLVLIAVSELVTNALVHGSPPRRLSMVRHRNDVDVVVSDGSPELPHLRKGSDTEPGGRGLRAVDRIADGWGVRPLGSGKEVWCRIPLGFGC